MGRKSALAPLENTSQRNWGNFGPMERKDVCKTTSNEDNLFRLVHGGVGSPGLGVGEKVAGILAHRKGPSYKHKGTPGGGARHKEFGTPQRDRVYHRGQPSSLQLLEEKGGSYPISIQS